jgi:hypothetical protein
MMRLKIHQIQHSRKRIGLEDKMIKLERTVDTKPVFKRDERSETIIDLLVNDYAQNPPTESLKGYNLYRVDETAAMRPDLVTKAMYGYLDPLERVLKFNQVSNPFSIDVGDVFYVWDIPSTENVIRGTSDKKRKREDVRNQYITPEKKSTVDPRLATFENRPESQKPNPSKGKASLNLPPNLAEFGDQEITLVNGKLVLGGAVTGSTTEGQDPISKSDYIKRLIKKRLTNNSNRPNIQEVNAAPVESVVSTSASAPGSSTVGGYTLNMGGYTIGRNQRST